MVLSCEGAFEQHLFSPPWHTGSHRVTRVALVPAKAQEVAVGAMSTVKTMMTISTVNTLPSVDQTPLQATLYREKSNVQWTLGFFIPQSEQCSCTSDFVQGMFSANTNPDRCSVGRQFTRWGTNLISEKFLF